MTHIPSPMFGDPIGPWRRWFAWRPVRTFDGVLCWLRPVRRRRIQLHDYLSFGTEHWWQYALPGDVTDDPTTAATPAYREGHAAYFAGESWGINPYGPVTTFRADREPTSSSRWDQGWQDARALPWWRRLVCRFTPENHDDR